MNEATPSRTALRVALRRAAHQLYDAPLVFKDPLAVSILGDKYADELRRIPMQPERGFAVGLRSFLVARSRYAEENLARAVDAGMRQYVLLGAGLDTFGCRNPYDGLRVFEVDHPATQAWKRELLGRSGIPVPESLTFAPVDFEYQTLAKQLAAAGFDFDAPAFFGWLGVVPYLTLEAFRATLAFISGAPRRKRCDPRLRAAARGTPTAGENGPRCVGKASATCRRAVPALLHACANGRGAGRLPEY